MATKVRQLSTLLTAKNVMKKGMRSANLSLRKFAKKSSAIAHRAGLLIGAGIATGIGLSIRSFLKLDDAMTRSLAITKGVSKEMRSELLKTAQVLSKDVTFAAHELAEGYFFLSSAGKNLAQSQVLLKDVALFAQAGQFDLATATTLLADSQKALGLSSKNVAKDQKSLVRVSDVLVKANTLANANTQQFSEALTNQAGPAMRAFKIDLEEGVAVLAAYADQGIKGAEAGTMLGRMLRLMIPAAVANKEAYKKLNIEVFNAEGNLNNMADIASDLTKAFSGMSVAQRATALESLGFAKKMQAAVFPILGAGKSIAKYEEELRKAGGTTKEIAENQLNSVNAQWKLFINNVNAATASLLNFESGAFSIMNILKDINAFLRNNGLKMFFIEAGFAAEKFWLIGSNVFDNMKIALHNGLQGIKAVGQGLLGIGRFLFTIGKTILASALQPVVALIEKVKALFDVIKDPTNATAWKKALSPIGIDIAKGITENIKQGVEEIKGIKTGVQFKSMIDNTQKLLDLEEARKKAILDAINAVGSKPLPLPKGMGGLGGKEASTTITKPSERRVESSVVSAVQRGTSEAIKLENQRMSGQKKIEQNTKKSAITLDKILKTMTRRAPAGDFNIPTIDVFSGSLSTRTA